MTPRPLAVLVAALLLVTLAASAGAQSAEAIALQPLIDRAPTGALLELPPGLYRGPIRIERQLHLRGAIGPGGERAIVDGGGIGTVVTITASGSALEGLLIRAGGNDIDGEDSGVAVEGAADVRLVGNRLEDVLYGVRGVGADRLQVVDNRIGGRALHVARRGDGIRLWECEEALVEGNTVEHVRDAIFWFSDGTVVRNNRFLDSRYGVHMMYTDGMIVEANELMNNSVGAYLMYSTDVEIRENRFQGNRGPSGYGLALKDMDAVTVTGNSYVDNRVGIFFDNSPSRVDRPQVVERNTLAFNDIGVLMMPAVRNNILRNNTFLDNLEQVALKGGGSRVGDSLGANGWDGNYWSDYVGYDDGTDGVGELPYRADSLFESLTVEHPELALLHFSPVEQAVDLAARAFPIIKPKPKLTDNAPRVVPSLPDIPPSASPPNRGLGVVATLLLAGTSLLLFQSGRRGVEPVGDFARERAAPTPREGRGTGSAPSPAAGVMIQVRDLTKRFPEPGRPWWSDATVTAVEGLSFALPEGESLALWGANGAGKTTVLKCLLGLLDCEGELKLDGVDLRANGREARRHFGYVPQELAFHHDLTVDESLRFYARLKGVGGARIDEVLSQVGIADQRRKRVGALSGGMKQRLALALALLADPPLLLLDEPTSNLDASTRHELLTLLSRLHAAGKTLLFTSHHLDEVEELADRVLILRDGRLAQLGTPTELADVLDPRRSRARRQAAAPPTPDRVASGLTTNGRQEP